MDTLYTDVVIRIPPIHESVFIHTRDMFPKHIERLPRELLSKLHLSFHRYCMQICAAFLLCTLADMPAHPCRGCTGTLAVAEDMHSCKVHLADKVFANGEFLIGFAGETNNHIRRDANAGDRFSCCLYQRPKLDL